MTIVDTHAHASPYWAEPVEVLLFQMDKNHVDKATLAGMNGLTDEKYNRYIIDCARRFPGRFSPVVRIDTERADAAEILKHWVDEGAEGLRLDVFARSPGKDPLAVWRVCAELGLPVSCQGYKKEDFADEEFRKLIEEFPDLSFIIEHLGKPDESDPHSLYSKTLQLSRFSNVYIKVGGLGEICQRPFPFRDPFYTVKGVPDFVRRVYEAFGPARMMWSSNYPPCSRLEGYKNTICYLEDHLDTFCGEEEKQWIFGKTALTLYPFRQA